MKYILTLSVFSFFSFAFTQNKSGCKWLKNGHQFSESIIKSSITSKTPLSVDSNHILSFTGLDSALICFSYVPQNLVDTIQEYKQSEVLNLESFEAIQKKKENNTRKISNLATNGAITRGLAVGNSGGNGVDSRLNLSLEGELTKGVFVKAYISDQDIPIQPDGITQNAQDLDRIYVSLYTKNKGLTLGDITFQDSSYFLRYLRNLQGASIFTQSIDSTFDLKTKFGIGVSKGKFFSNQLVLRSGVLGPYKVEGPASNQFTVIISGSEKIFLDGQLLIRGKDYIMDYNQSLVTFLSHILITEYSRVKIDFEYSDFEYFRVNSMVHIAYEEKKVQLNVAYYTENDNPNKPINTTYSQQDLLQLSEVGDDSEGAVIPGQSDVSNVTSGVWYRKEDVQGVEVFVYTSDLDSAEYEVSFTDVGEGNGDYEVINRELNGVVYGYVGAGLGSFLPLVPVALPHQKQLLTANLRYKVSKNVTIGNEIGYSVKDNNKYSVLNDDDNEGVANNLYYSIKALNNQKYKLKWLGNLEFVSLNFEQIDRFRGVDFDRNWGTSSSVSNGLLLSTHQIVLQKDKWNLIQVTGAILQKESDQSGTRFGMKFKKSITPKITVGGGYEDISTGYLSNISRWQNSEVGLSYRAKENVFKVQYNAEHNKTKNDTVLSTTQYYDQVGLSWTKGRKISLLSTYRIDKDTLGSFSEFRNRTEALITQLSYQVFKTRSHLLEVNGVHRQANQREGVEEQQVQGGIVFRSKWKSFLTQKLVYNLSSAQELQREFVFVQVAYGKGSHRFIDFDGDNQQSITEFVEDDIAGDYIKVIVPTNDFIDVYKASLKYQSSWSLHKSKKVFLKYFSGQFVFNGSDRTQNNDLLTRVIPIKGKESSAYSQQYLAELYFHRSKGWYELYYKIQDYDVFNQYLRGEDKRRTNVNKIGIRNKLNALTLNTYYEWGTRDYRTTIVVDNDYVISHQGIKEELSKVFKRKLSVTLLGNYEVRQGQQIKEAFFWEIGMRSRLLVNKVGLNSSLSFVGIDHNATSIEESTQEGFVMLDGLRKGANYRWTLNIQKKVTKSIQLNISYQGRKPDGQQVYHIGRMQATAYF